MSVSSSMCLRECKRLQGQVTALTAHLHPLLCCLFQAHPFPVSWENYFIFSQVCHYPPLTTQPHGNCSKKMLRANWINTTVYGLGT